MKKKVFLLFLMIFSCYAIIFGTIVAFGDPSPASTVSDTSDTLKIEFENISPTVLKTNTDITTKVKITNRAKKTLENIHVNLRIAPALLVSRAQLAHWSRNRPGVGTVVATENINALPAESATSITLQVKPNGIPPLEGWGTRGISVETTLGTSPEVQAMTASFIVHHTEDRYQPLQLVPLTSLTTPSSQESELATATGDHSPLTNVLRLIKDHPFSTAVDPSLLKKVTSSNIQNLQNWNKKFNEITNREFISLPYFDPDIMALSHTLEENPLQVFNAQTRTLGVIPHSARTDISWPVAGAMSPEAISKLLTSSDSVLIDSENFLAKEGVIFTPDALTTIKNDLTTTKAVVIDHDLSQLLAQITENTNQPQLIQRFLAETATITREQPSISRHIVLATPRNWNPVLPKVDALMKAISEVPWIKFSTLSDTIAGNPNSNYGPLSYTPEQAHAEINSTVIIEAEKLRKDLIKFSHIVKGTSNLNAESTEAMAQLASASYREHQDQQQKDAQKWQKKAELITKSVEIIETSNLNLLTDTVDIKFLVVNKHTEPINLKIVATASNTKLRVENPPPVVIAAGRQTNITVGLKAVGSGETKLTLTPESLQGQAVGQAIQIPVTINVQWGNIFTNIILGIALVLMSLGIWRTVKKRRTNAAG